MPPAPTPMACVPLTQCYSHFKIHLTSALEGESCGYVWPSFEDFSGCTTAAKPPTSELPCSDAWAGSARPPPSEAPRAG